MSPPCLFPSLDERERVDAAVDLKIAALLHPGEKPKAAPTALAAGDLTSNEKKVYGGLKGSPTAARRYLSTRDFLRKCDAVHADHSKAEALPIQPERFDARYLSADELKRVDDAVDLNVLALMKES